MSIKCVAMSAPPCALPVRVQVILFYFGTPELLVTKGLIFSQLRPAFERRTAFLGNSADHSVISDNLPAGPQSTCDQITINFIKSSISGGYVMKRILNHFFLITVV